MRAFAQFLMQFPSNATKHFPNVDPRAVPDLARAKKLPTMTTITANDYLSQLSDLTKFALNEGFITTDPAKGSLIMATKTVSAKDRRGSSLLPTLPLAPVTKRCIAEVLPA